MMTLSGSCEETPLRLRRCASRRCRRRAFHRGQRRSAERVGANIIRGGGRGGSGSGYYPIANDGNSRRVLSCAFMKFYIDDLPVRIPHRVSWFCKLTFLQIIFPYDRIYPGLQPPCHIVNRIPFTFTRQNNMLICATSSVHSMPL